MSVIIQMLKELEQRQKPDTVAPSPQPVGEFVPPQIQYQTATKTRMPLISLVVVAVLLIPTLWFGVSLYRQANHQMGNEITAINSIETKESKSLDVHQPQKGDSSDVDLTQLGLKPTLIPSQESVPVSQASITQNTPPKIEQTPVLGAASSDKTALNDDAINLSTATHSLSKAEQKESVDLPETVEKPFLLAAKQDNDKPSSPNANNTVPNKVATDEVVSTKGLPSKNTAAYSETSQELTTTQTSVAPVKAADIRQESAEMTVKEVVLTKTQLAQLQYRKGVNAEQAQRLDDATGYYLEALVLQPSLHNARKQLVAIYYAQNNLTAVTRLLESGISLFPQQWDFYVILSQIQTEMNAYDKALSTLNAIPDDSVWTRDKWVAQTELAQSSKNFSLAESAYRHLLVSESTNARWWMGLGYALDSQKKYSQAAQAYRSALSYEGLSTSAMTFIENRLDQLGESR